jgi:integrase
LERLQQLSKGTESSRIVEYSWNLKKQGYADSTIENYTFILKKLVTLGANLDDPETVKGAIAKQDWSSGRKWNITKAYTLWLKQQNKTWVKPKYKAVRKLPFIPTEQEVDSLIAGASNQMAAFLLILKETGVRSGEAFQILWTDLDYVNSSVRITPEKGSNPRVFKISPKLMVMLQSLPHTTKKVFRYSRMLSVTKTFIKQRRRIAAKLGNPRLMQIHFHTLRHWKASMEYAKTKDILYVMKLLGHKNIKTTLIHTQLVDISETQYICKAAKTKAEATQLIESGFEYVTTIEDCQLYKKRK